MATQQVKARLLTLFKGWRFVIGLHLDGGRLAVLVPVSFCRGGRLTLPAPLSVHALQGRGTPLRLLLCRLQRVTVKLHTNQTSLVDFPVFSTWFCKDIKMRLKM